MGQIVLNVENIVKEFKKFRAVNSVTFEVPEGQILGLLGPNGTGKTTLIAMLLGILSPSSGTIRVFEMNFKDQREEILGQVNFSSTYISMPLSLTVKENLNFFSKLYHVPDGATRISELLRLCEIEQYKNHLTRDLSSGQLSRLNLAKALLNRPRILFLDEPTASLDPAMARKVRKILVSLKNEYRSTIVYTSHNMREIEQISDRIIFLNRGVIIADGTPEQITKFFQKETLEEVFLKVARETFVK